MRAEELIPRFSVGPDEYNRIKKTMEPIEHKIIIPTKSTTIQAKYYDTCELYIPEFGEEIHQDDIGKKVILNHTTEVCDQELSGELYSFKLRKIKDEPLHTHPFEISLDTIEVIAELTTQPYTLTIKLYNSSQSNIIVSSSTTELINCEDYESCQISIPTNDISDDDKNNHHIFVRGYPGFILSRGTVNNDIYKTLIDYEEIIRTPLSRDQIHFHLINVSRYNQIQVLSTTSNPYKVIVNLCGSVDEYQKSTNHIRKQYSEFIDFCSTIQPKLVERIAFMDYLILQQLEKLNTKLEDKQ